MASTLIVISFYDRRPTTHLSRLFASLDRHSAGAEYDIAIVANRTSDRPLDLPLEGRPVRVHERENLGMNIGAWDHGWRVEPDYARYLFLQDECFAVRDGWLAAFNAKLDDPSVGLAGESLNPAWDKPWPELAKRHAGVRLPDHYIDGEPAERVDVYLDFMRRNAIDPGASGRHLRSLIWAARRDVLDRIGGFPIGANYGECIAAEIGVSRSVEGRGLALAQLSSEPFRFFRHAEYNRDHPAAPFTHVAGKNPPPPDASGRIAADAKATPLDASATATPKPESNLRGLAKRLLGKD